jgi:hypothetical protein
MIRIGWLAILACLCIRPAGAALKAAVVKVDITPERPEWLLGYGARQSNGTHDPIFHRVLLLDDGKTQFAWASSDLCLFSPSFYDGMASTLEKRFGIKPVNFWWSVTHTHSAPEVGPPGMPGIFLGDRYTHQRDETYTKMVERKLEQAIEDARARLEPVRFGVGWGSAFANINRRARDIEGPAFLGMNPDGPVDRRLGVLRFDRMDGSPLALVTNYAIHGTVLGGTSLVISGDAPGIAAAYVEEKLKTTVLFVNGAAGDIAPIYSVQPNPKAGRLTQFRVLLGDRIIETASRAKTEDGAHVLAASAITVQVPRKNGLGWAPDLGRYTLKSAYGREMVQLPVRFLHIGTDTAIWSAPLELFCQVAIGVRERSPFANTLYGGYTNGWLGYLPTEVEWGRGGYEPGVSPFTPPAEHELSSAVLQHLETLKH